jgi:hypothetical protein
MNQAEYDKLSIAFLKAFASVPASLRNQIIAVVDGSPYTWESAFVEVKAKTDKSKKILAELKSISVIE